MIKWRLTDLFADDDESEAVVSLDIENGNQAAVMQFSGDAQLIEEARLKFKRATGVFGHLITSADEPVTGFDADYLLDGEVIEGAELLANGYDAEIPEDALS